MRCKPDGVQMLWFLAQKVSVRVRKHKNTVNPGNCSRLAASITRQARVSERMHVACAHLLAGFETCGGRDVAVRRGALAKHCLNHLTFKWGSRSRRTWGRFARLDFCRGGQAAFDQLLLQPNGPRLVIAHP